MGRRRRFRISKWQAVIVAAIGAAGAVAAAVVPAAVQPGPSPSPTASPAETVAISTVTQELLSGGEIQYTFTGTSTRIDPDDMLIFVMAQGTTPVADGGTWMVSPAATVAANGNWNVTWTLRRVPQQTKWVATIYDGSCTGDCAPDTPAGKLARAEPEAVANELASDGPGDVKATYSPAAPKR